MFSAHSPYSPFFTSGLLSEPISANRGATADRHSAIYFDVIFSDDDRYRSFLSLDLAETRSLHSLAIKRKPSSKYSARSSDRSHSKFHPILEAPSSCGSPRPMPSPKPIPSTTLPEPPTHPTRFSISPAPPRLPSLPPLLPLDLDLATSSTHKSVSPIKSPPSSRIHSVCAPIRAPSTVSTCTRLRNRAAALALLEGRQKLPLPATSSGRHSLKNFMSMSDDEDQDSDDGLVLESDDGLGGPANPKFETRDLILPTNSRILPPSYTSHDTISSHEELSRLGVQKVSHKRTRKGSTKTSDWFPFKSFIDLYNDNDEDLGPSNWNWRSFIELASAS